MGLWQDDNRHGNGVIVTLDGLYFEGNFVGGKITVRVFVTYPGVFKTIDFCLSIILGETPTYLQHPDIISGVKFEELFPLLTVF